MISNYSKKIKISGTAIFALLFGMATAQAVTVDGIDTSGDNYDNVKSLGFAKGGINCGTPCVEGQLKWTIDGDKIFVLISIPTDHVDNVFNPDENAQHVVDAGWTSGGHKYKELRGSDKVEFTLAYDDGTSKTLLDLINDDHKAEVGETKNNGVKEGDPGGLFITGSEEFRMKTSLEYNIANFLGGTASDNSISLEHLAGWETQIMYEFVLDATKFDSSGSVVFGLGNFSAVDLHASPSKTGTDSWTPQCFQSGSSGCLDTPPGTTYVPEPGPLGPLAVGLMGLVFLRRRKSQEA